MNAFSQISTSKVQSARLLQCGVKEDTADMTWRKVLDSATPELRAMSYKSSETIYGKDDVTPAWSLSRLLALMPPTIQKDKTIYYLDFAPYDNKGWGFGYFNAEGVRSIKGLTQPSDPIEASVCLIEWLMRNNYPLNVFKADTE